MSAPSPEDHTAPRLLRSPPATVRPPLLLSAAWSRALGRGRLQAGVIEVARGVDVGRGIVGGVGWVEVEDLYAEHAAALVRFSATVVGPSDAEDLVAAVMVELLRRPDCPVADLRAYAYRSVLNAGLKLLRTSGRRQRRESLFARPDRIDDDDVVPEVVAAIAELSPQQRAVVHLTYWEDLTPAAVAVRIGVREGTVRRQLARGRHRLREVLYANATG